METGFNTTGSTSDCLRGIVPSSTNDPSPLIVLNNNVKVPNIFANLRGSSSFSTAMICLNESCPRKSRKRRVSVARAEKAIAADRVAEYRAESRISGGPTDGSGRWRD